MMVHAKRRIASVAADSNRAAGGGQRRRPGLLAALLLLLAPVACGPDSEPGVAGPAESSAAPAPTNRIEIPATIRRNLGIAFVRVERRVVERSLRVPGRFELLPTARREYRAPLGGRVELLVEQFAPVEPGQALARIHAPAWQELRERIGATEARLASMGPVREAHRVHEARLAEKVALWEERIGQLEALRSAGGGGAAQETDARATLNATQAELADVMEKDAELEAQQRVLEAELRALRGRAVLLAGGPAHAGSELLEIRAVAPGFVESIEVTDGGLLDESGLVLSVVQPERVRFRAVALQSDLGLLRDGLRATIAPPQGGSIAIDATMRGALRLGLGADPQARTVDLIVEPESLLPWARAGVAGHLEIALDGGVEALAIPRSAVVQDGTEPIVFRRDPANPDRAIRLVADLGASDGRWVVLESGVREGDEIVLEGNFQLMVATSGSGTRGGHFHADGTFHADDH